MKDALEIRGREYSSHEENISAKAEKRKKIARFYEEDVHRRRQENPKPQEEKGTG